MHMAQNLKNTISPGWVAQLFRVSSHTPKGLGFDFLPGNGFDPQSGSRQVATDQYFSLTRMSLSLSFLPPSPSQINENTSSDED